MNTTLERVIIQGVLQYLGRAFGPVVSQQATEQGSTVSPLQPKFISSSDKWHVLKQLQTQTGVFQYPYLFLKLTNAAIQDAGMSYNPKALLRAGVYGGVDDSKTTYRRHRIIPVAMQCEVSFLTNDFWQSMAFVNAWMFAAVKKNLNFNVKFDDVAYSIRVDLEANLATPEKDNSVDLPNNYEMVGTLTIHAYFSENKAMVDVERYPIFRTLHVNPVLVTTGTPQEQIELNLRDDLPPQYIEIPNDEPYVATQYENIILEIKNVDDAPDEK